MFCKRLFPRCWPVRSWVGGLLLVIPAILAGCSGPTSRVIQEAKDAGHLVVLWRDSNETIEMLGRADGNFKVRFTRINEPPGKKYWVVLKCTAKATDGKMTMGSSFRSDATRITETPEGELRVVWNGNTGLSQSGQGIMQVVVIDDTPLGKPETQVSNVLEVPVKLR